MCWMVARQVSFTAEITCHMPSESCPSSRVVSGYLATQALWFGRSGIVVMTTVTNEFALPRHGLDAHQGTVQGGRGPVFSAHVAAVYENACCTMAQSSRGEHVRQDADRECVRTGGLTRVLVGSDSSWKSSRRMDPPGRSHSSCLLCKLARYSRLTLPSSPRPLPHMHAMLHPEMDFASKKYRCQSQISKP